MATRTIFMHGDVLLRPVESIPEGAKKIQDEGDLILQKGTASGNAHRIQSKKEAALFQGNTKRFLEVKEPVMLVHEEHHAKPLPVGFYEIDFQRRKNYLTGMVEAVLD